VPQDRLRHQRAGHSQKLTALKDFEYRVWDQYQLSADDFGIMRCSPLKIQADNDALAQRPQKLIQKALERLIEVELVKKYEHQGSPYIFDPVWQFFQKVEYPKQTINPAPPDDMLAEAHPLTIELFRQCFGKPSTKFRVKGPENSAKTPEESSENSPLRAGARAEEAKANGKRQTADAALHVLDAFRGSWKAAYGFECSLILKPLEQVQLEQHAATHGEDLLFKAIAAYFASTDPFVAKARHSLALFLREPLKYLAKDPVRASRPRGCQHTPPCVDDARHTSRLNEDERRAG
jgi:hypothetical protein